MRLGHSEKGTYKHYGRRKQKGNKQKVCKRLGHSEKGRKGVYGLGCLWRIVWCLVIGVIGAVKVLLCVIVG